jgi:hypothetical protein
MNRCFVFRVPCFALIVLLFSMPVFADSKDENLKPLEAPSEAGRVVETATPVSPELEEKYRAELEKRLAQERESYAGSLRSLWLANAAVWACLLIFIGVQAVSARKKSAELARLKSERGA